MSYQNYIDTYGKIMGEFAFDYYPIMHNEKEELVLNFIFNILTSNTVMNRYCSTRYGNIIENKDISIKECINYVAKKIIGFNESEE